MIKCEIVKTVISIENKNAEVYGLTFYREGERTPFKTVEDIFTELALAEKLKRIINENDVDEIHIDNIIEDAII